MVVQIRTMFPSLEDVVSRSMGVIKKEIEKATKTEEILLNTVKKTEDAIEKSKEKLVDLKRVLDENQKKLDSKKISASEQLKIQSDKLVHCQYIELIKMKIELDELFIVKTKRGIETVSEYADSDFTGTLKMLHKFAVAADKKSKSMHEKLQEYQKVRDEARLFRKRAREIADTWRQCTEAQKAFQQLMSSTKEGNSLVPILITDEMMAKGLIARDRKKSGSEESSGEDKSGEDKSGDEEKSDKGRSDEEKSDDTETVGESTEEEGEVEESGVHDILAKRRRSFRMLKESKKWKN